MNLNFFQRWLVLAGLALSIASLSAADASPREKVSLDFAWKFHLGNEWGFAVNRAKAASGSGPASVWFGDGGWRTVDLPHDWAVELPFDARADAAHGFKAIGHGFPQNSVAWYRRSFQLTEADAGKRLWLEFDGVFRACDVFVNGWLVGHHDGGYNSFRYDITDVAECGGTNFIAVKVDASEFEGWFYEGAGIYRHVWLVKTEPVAVAPDGVFVFSRFQDNVPDGPAEIAVETEVTNFGNLNAQGSVTWSVLDADGRTVGKTSRNFSIEPCSQTKVSTSGKGAQLVISKPMLWSPESPKLYRLVTSVAVDGRQVDRVDTEFGVRTVAFDADKGFLLNGQPYLIKGICNHQDHAGVGVALPDALQYFRISKLKESGANAYRTAHGQPANELLEACDRLGMLVMDENRHLGSDEQNMSLWKEQIRHDRNHPSIVVWSIANEENSIQAKPVGARVAKTMLEALKQLDPTRPVTYAANLGNVPDGINGAAEVRGWNYHVSEDMDKYHAEHPTQPNIGSEQGATVATRGIYENDAIRGYVSAYDDNAQTWSSTAKQWWSFFAPRPWLSGGFVWTGFDYRGEPTPYLWPCVNSHFGIFDTCGFPKDNFYYYQAWWTEKPVLHLLPHWNWHGEEGREVDVRALSNCEEVELFLNGRSLGRKRMEKYSELKWGVKYAPGVLSAKGYNAGKVVVESKEETTDAPTYVQVTPDRTVLKANGQDISVITVSVTDAQGRVVPTATNLIRFQLDGPGKIIGVGNGDPSCHEPDVFLPQKVSRSLAINKGWHWKKIPSVRFDLPELSGDFKDAGWSAADVLSDSGVLGEQEQAIFRAKVRLTEKDLDASTIQMRFGAIDEDAWVFVNGIPIGEWHDWQGQSFGWIGPAFFDVKPALHPGENDIAVIVANWSGTGGLHKGITLEFQGKPVDSQWQRSAFNGLASVIVQAMNETGEIKLKAISDGLKSGASLLTALPSSTESSLAAEPQSTPNLNVSEMSKK